MDDVVGWCGGGVVTFNNSLRMTRMTHQHQQQAQTHRPVVLLLELRLTSTLSSAPSALLHPTHPQHHHECKHLLFSLLFALLPPLTSATLDMSDSACEASACIKSPKSLSADCKNNKNINLVTFLCSPRPDTPRMPRYL